MTKLHPIRLLLLSIFTFFVLTNNSQAAVWETKNQWNDVWEKHYQNWVKFYWTPDKFMDSRQPDYYLIPHDCADAVYLMRLIFAYENKLPFVIKHPNKRSTLIGNSMSKWDKTKDPVKRLRKFIRHLNGIVGTRSIPYDTYPIALSEIKPGDIYVAPGIHSYQITDITETGVPVIMSSTTPLGPKFLAKLTSFPFFVPEHKKQLDGYRRFIQPQNIKKPIEKQPKYSNEQFVIAAEKQHNFIYFTDVMAKKLGKRPETQEEKSERLINALCSFAKERTDYVSSAVFYMENIRNNTKRNCMDAKEYDYYSTPSRDKRLKRFFEEVRNNAFTKGKKTDQSEWSALRVAQAIFQPQPNARDLSDLEYFCQIPLVEESRETINLRQLWLNLARGLVSSDPNAPLEARWGNAKKAYKSSCPSY